MSDQMRRYAAIDIGTVTCRMLVADVCDGRIIERAKEYAITNLGAGVDATGHLSKDAIARVVGVIKGYLAIRDALDSAAHPLCGTIAMTTSAARDADNASEFVDALRNLGVELSVIPGSKEAALSFRGATSDLAAEAQGLRLASERVAVVDIGGGSTEIAVGLPGKDPLFSHSFNLGCRRVTERCLKSDPPTCAELTAARLWIREELQTYLAHHVDLGRASRIIAVAGTATSMVSIRESMETYDSSIVHGSVVTADELAEITQRLSALTTAERRNVVGLDPDRAPVIVAGALILQEVLEVFGLQEFTASEHDILQGMILEASTARP